MALFKIYANRFLPLYEKRECMCDPDDLNSGRGLSRCMTSKNPLLSDPSQ